MGYSEICFRIARGRARGRSAPPSYSKANLEISHTESVKKTVPKWRDARIARARVRKHLNSSYAYVYCAYEF